jgi:hypothetical protein
LPYSASEGGVIENILDAFHFMKAARPLMDSRIVDRTQQNRSERQCITEVMTGGKRHGLESSALFFASYV